jgi:hypothetical protein
MIRQVAIMYAVAALLLLVGAGCPGGAARAYVLRMTGIMALAAGVMLAAGAGSMQRWSVAG